MEAAPLMRVPDRAATVAARVFLLGNPLQGNSCPLNSTGPARLCPKGCAAAATGLQLGGGGPSAGAGPECSGSCGSEHQPLHCWRAACRSYCPTPSEERPCPAGHFCRAGSLQPQPCPFLTSCPEGSGARRPCEGAAAQQQLPHLQRCGPLAACRARPSHPSSCTAPAVPADSASLSFSGLIILLACMAVRACARRGRGLRRDTGPAAAVQAHSRLHA